MYRYRPVFWIHNPVFPHTGIGVFIQLQQHIFGTCGRRKDLDQQIRSAFIVSIMDVIVMAKYHKIRLYHGVIVFIQANIQRRKENMARHTVLVCTLPEQEVHIA